MPQIASYDEVKANRKQREIPGGYAWRTEFIPHGGVPGAPNAFLAEGTPGRVIRPHFHEVDQYQVIVSGGGVLGKHPLAIHAVHYANAHTPYGPLTADDRGLGFLTLRAHWDKGAQYLPAAREDLKRVAGRTPWQVTELPNFDGANDVNVHAFSQIRNDQGLAAYSLKLKPNARAQAPDPANGDGQYVIVTRGSLLYEGAQRQAITIAFLKPGEAPLPLIAGAEGLEALVLNYPRPRQAVAREPVAAKSPGFRVWQCLLCSFVYDEAKGMPDEGIAPGTRWEDVPETWTCPDCSASKSDFQMSVVA